jgi:hypothetical protein
MATFAQLRSLIISNLMRFTQTTLKKMEAVFSELGYAVRYEKGNFQSGYCLVENRKIAVINKFFDTEARINTLLDILNTLPIDETALSDDSKAKLKQWKKALDDTPEESVTPNQS